MRKRLSVSSTRSESPLVFATAPNADSEEWVSAWKAVSAKGTSASLFSDCPGWLKPVGGPLDIIDSPVIAVDAETSVEDACEVSNLSCRMH